MDILERERESTLSVYNDVQRPSNVRTVKNLKKIPDNLVVLLMLE